MTSNDVYDSINRTVDMSSEGSYTAFLTTEEVLGCLKAHPRTIAG